MVFARLPTSGKLHDELERCKPKREFWNKFAAATSAETIHFQDVPTLADFECPDWSHLDVRDAPRFFGLEVFG